MTVCLLCRAVRKKGARFATPRASPTAARSFSSYASHLPPLPPVSEWGSLRASTTAKGALPSQRPWLHNISSMSQLLDEWGLSKDDGKGPKTVVEIYAGPGSLSRAILTLPRERIERLVILESDKLCLKQLELLANADDRVRIIPKSAFYWESYDDARSLGFLDHLITDFDSDVHPQLRVLGVLPMTTHVEQLLSQIIRMVPARSWMWQYGRVPVQVVMSEWFRARLTSPSGDKSRSKLSVMSSATADVTSIPRESLFSPWESNLHPTSRHIVSREIKMIDKRLTDGAAKDAMVGVTIIPKPMKTVHKNIGSDNADWVEAWDFVLRGCFIGSKQTIERALKTIAPNANIILQNPICANISPSTKVKDVTLEQWTAIITAFQEWPFKPTELVMAGPSGIRIGKQTRAATQI